MESKPKQRKSLKSVLLSGAGFSVFTMFVWELVEEGLENLIAYALSSAVAVFITKALSTLAIITATQGIKVTLKSFLLPIIKNYTYKDGNDKMSKIKNFFSWLNANKCTIGGIVTGGLVAVSGAGVIDVSALPALIVGSLNITPILYYVVLGVLAIVCSFFPETIEKFKARFAEKQAEKANNAIVKEAEKELATEKKLANQTQAEQEKAQAKAEKEAQAKAEKEKAEAEHRAKVEAVKAQIKAQTK